MSLTRRSVPLLLLSSFPLLRSQIIPNPNQERLGMPDPRSQTPPPDNKNRHEATVRQAHAEALQSAEELFALAEQLRDDLKKAGNYVVPVASITQTEKIEKLAKKIRSQLKT